MILMMSLEWCVSWCHCGGAIDASFACCDTREAVWCATHDPVKGMLAVVVVVVVLGWVLLFELI